MRPSRAAEIAAIVARLIEEGHLPLGSRVPSVRAAAEQHGVSKNTVVEAYDRLVASGHLEPRRGSGFYVRRPKRRGGDLRPVHVSEAIDLVSLLREQLDRHYSVRVGDGRPPASWMEESELGRHLRPRSAFGEGRMEHGYGTPPGYEPLRGKIAHSLIERSIRASAEQVLLTFGANHGLDLIVRQYVEPGDSVLVDSPGYYPLFGKLRLARAGVVGVRRGPEGPDLEDFEAKARAVQPKLFFTQTLAHNPTGGSVPLDAQHRLLQLAEQHGVTLVEDDPFADILPLGSPRLAALDQLERVIYVGTFSKTLSASLRSGYIAGSAELIRQLTDVKMLTVVNSSGYVERLLFELIAGGHYRRHLKRLRERVERASATALERLRGLGFEGLGEPAGGFYLWCPLPEGLDDIALARLAARQGIFLAPSSIFAVPGDYRTAPAIRINVAYADDPAFLAFMAEVRAGEFA
ncbi:MAG: PLP-dependent aminotransferase family protein [Tistlia sp.]|uniref:PLP-dependent aminotransferase family protein n=1 Tax=Tistlia sp. TaxID=3057121 RepID=UPI0034A55013